MKLWHTMPTAEAIEAMYHDAFAAGRYLEAHHLLAALVDCGLSAELAGAREQIEALEDEVATLVNEVNRPDA